MRLDDHRPAPEQVLVECQTCLRGQMPADGNFRFHLASIGGEAEKYPPREGEYGKASEMPRSTQAREQEPGSFCRVLSDEARGKCPVASVG